jgi:hypothetical protein
LAADYALADKKMNAMIEKHIYLNAIRRPEKHRTPFIRTVCGAAEELRESVESMIAAHQELSGNCGDQTISLVLADHHVSCGEENTSH